MIGEDNDRAVNEALKAALKKLTPNRRTQIKRRFADFYTYIEDALAEGKTQKAIIATLAEFDLKVSPAKFNKLRKEEAERRAKGPSGENRQ